VATQDIPTVQPAPPAPSKAVLIVEDEPLLRILIADELRDCGYDVCEANDADAALSELTPREFDLLLTDVQMPGSLDGLALAERARCNRPRMKIIIFTGNAPDGAQGAFADMILKKPVDFAVLLDSVRGLLSQL
jgi:CheY-like chemotaxis protein